jgi:hypothetical protein
MTLAGSDMTACKRYFTQSMGKLLGFLQNEIASLDEICDGYRISEGGNSRGARHWTFTPASSVRSGIRR